MTTLQQVITNIDVIDMTGDANVEVTGVTYDSRQVEKGFLFVCIEGFNTDGHKYAAQAIAKGASAVVAQKVISVEGATIITVKDTRVALAQAAAAFYDYPGKHLNMIGVTGTNGKTTTTYLLSDVLKNIGKKTGVIGTIHNLIGDKIVPSAHTTPESSDLQKLLSVMVDEKVSDVIMEVSSHALSLARVKALEFKGAIYTNLTQDHLDFHKDMEDYFLAKSYLFSDYGVSDRINVINIDDEYGKRLVSKSIGKNITYSINNAEADFRASDIKLLQNGISYKVNWSKGRLDLNLKLLGEFNVYNSLAVVAYAIAAGIKPELVKEALEKAKGVPGRFEIVDAGQPFTVAVDYAHTPDGLQNILTSANEFTTGKIITVFGCGGDRDRTKRPKMGRIAAELSDQVIVTSDNPRTEEPLAIIKDIEEGIPKEAKATVHIEADRRTAIQKALSIAGSGDIVIIAGKGHEDYQILKDKTIHFDDREEAAVFLKGMGYEN